MTSKQAATLFSRAIGLSFFFGALFDITYLPERLYSIDYHTTARNLLSSEQYFRNAALLAALLLCLRIIANLVLGAWFFTSSARVKRLLLGADPEIDN